MFQRLLEQMSELKNLRETIFKKVEKVLSKETTPTQAIENETKKKTNHIVNEALIEAQTKMINDTDRAPQTWSTLKFSVR